MYKVEQYLKNMIYFVKDKISKFKIQNSITAFIATTGAFQVYADNIELQSFIKLYSLHFGEIFPRF